MAQDTDVVKPQPQPAPPAKPEEADQKDPPQEQDPQTAQDAQVAQDAQMAQDAELDPADAAAIAAATQDVNKIIDYRLQGIYFEGKHTHRVLQDVGGPCPLIGLCNVLFLRGDIRMNKNQKRVPFKTLTKCLEDHLQRLFETDYMMKPNVTEDQIANALKNITDCVELFPKLEEGLDINIRFSDCNSFEFTPQVAMFDSYNVTILHGWVVDPQDKELHEIMGDKSYNEVVDFLTNDQYSNDLTEADIAKIEGQKQLVRNFLEQYAHQLTEHGLHRIYECLNNREAAILFRNNHFSCIYKRNNTVFELCTDEGIIDADYRITWQTLSGVYGDTLYTENDFRIMGGFEINSSQHYESKPQSKEPSTNPDDNPQSNPTTDINGGGNGSGVVVDDPDSEMNPNATESQKVVGDSVDSKDDANNANNPNSANNGNKVNADNADTEMPQKKSDIDNGQIQDTVPQQQSTESDMELDSDNGDQDIDVNDIGVGQITENNINGNNNIDNKPGPKVIELNDEQIARNLAQQSGGHVQRSQSDEEVANDLALARAIQGLDDDPPPQPPAQEVNAAEKRSIEAALGWPIGSFDEMQKKHEEQQSQSQPQGQGLPQKLSSQQQYQQYAQYSHQQQQQRKDEEEFLKYKHKYPKLTYEQYRRHKETYARTGKKPDPDSDDCVIL